MQELLKRLKQNTQQLTILVVCFIGVLSILLLLGSSAVKENFVIKIFLFTCIFAAFAYFVITYRRQIIPELKNYLKEAIRKRNPNLLFPGDDGYEEAVEAQRRIKEESGLKVVKSNHPNESNNE